MGSLCQGLRNALRQGATTLAVPGFNRDALLGTASREPAIAGHRSWALPKSINLSISWYSTRIAVDLPPTGVGAMELARLYLTVGLWTMAQFPLCGRRCRLALDTGTGGGHRADEQMKKSQLWFLLPQLCSHRSREAAARPLVPFPNLSFR